LKTTLSWYNFYRVLWPEYRKEGKPRKGEPKNVVALMYILVQVYATYI
jgi:hypothetical protein